MVICPMRAEAGRPGLQMPSDLSVRPRLRCCAGAGHAQGSDVLCPVLPRLRTLVCAPASAAEVPAFGCPAPAPREPPGPRKDHDDPLDAPRHPRPVAAPQPRRARVPPGVREVFESLEVIQGHHPEYNDAGILMRLCEPERQIIFRV